MSEPPRHSTKNTATSVFSSLLTAYFCLTGHSSVSIYNTALLYIVLAPCGHLQTQRVAVRCIPCRGRMGSWWLKSPVGSNTLLRPGLPQSIGWSCFALISIRRQWLRVNQGIEVNFVVVVFYHLSILRFEPLCTLAGFSLVCIPLLDSVAGGDKT